MASPVARAGADLRMLRAAVFTAVCVVLSAAGHVLASCATVPLWTLGAGAAAMFAVALPLAGRERALPGIAAVLALGQLALHSLFGYGQQQAAAAAEAAHRVDAGEGRVIGMAAKLLCTTLPGRLDAATAHRIVARSGIDPSTLHSAPGTAAPGPEHQMGLTALLPSLPMTLGHLLAALAVGWLLRRGEMAVWRAVRLSLDGARGVAEAALVRSLRAALGLGRTLLAGLTDAASGAAPPRPRTDGADEGATTAVVLQHSVIRRGPPACELAA
ncbi:hypothetical protein ACFZCY_02510 [Streptomyces sp. NPDC007983]|uniref:hypothetical protein n=1 Tax=Streptomyces sp. NPDC007983 TaxID=3364800 RepID=UPI0036E8F260